MSEPSSQQHVWIVGARGFLGSALQTGFPVESLTLFDPHVQAGERGIPACEIGRAHV